MLKSSSGFIKKIAGWFSGSDAAVDFVDRVFQAVEVHCNPSEMVKSGYQSHLVSGAVPQLVRLLDPKSSQYRTIAYHAVYYRVLSIAIHAQKAYEQANYPSAMIDANKADMQDFCESMRLGVSNAAQFKHVFMSWLKSHIKQSSLDALVLEFLPALRDHRFARQLAGIGCLPWLDADLLLLSQAGELTKLFALIKTPNAHIHDILLRVAFQVLQQQSAGSVTKLQGALILALRKALEVISLQSSSDGPDGQVGTLLMKEAESKSGKFVQVFEEHLSIKHLKAHVPSDLGSLLIPCSEFKEIVEELCQDIAQMKEFPTATDIAAKMVQELCEGVTKQAHPPLCSSPCPMCRAPCLQPLGHQGGHRAVHQPMGLSRWHADTTKELIIKSCSKYGEEKGSFLVTDEKGDDQVIPYSRFHVHYPGWVLDLPDAVSGPEECKHTLSVREYLFAKHQDHILASHPRLTLKANPRCAEILQGTRNCAQFRDPEMKKLQELNEVDEKVVQNRLKLTEE